MIFRYDDIYNSKFTILKILEWSKYNSTNLMKRLLDDAKDKNVLLVEFYSSNFLCSSNLEEIGFTIDNKIINKIPNLFNPVNFGSTIRFAYELSDNLDEKLSFDFTKGASDLDRDKKGLYEI